MIDAVIIERAAPVLTELRAAENLLAKLKGVAGISGAESLVLHLGDHKIGQILLPIGQLREQLGISKEGFAEAIIAALITRDAKTIGEKQFELKQLGVQL